MHIAICDDNPQELKRIAAIVEKYAKASSWPIQYQFFSNAEEMLQSAESMRFSHYFLDVMMPGINGISAAQEIRTFDKEAKIVFMTSFKEYAYQSYSVKAYDYLLKPVHEEQLFDILEQFYLQEASTEACLCVQTVRGFFRIPYTQLSFLEVYQKKLYFHLVDKQTRIISGALAEYEAELLSRAEFVKIHRSYIVNLNQVSALSPDGCLLFSGENLPISRLLYHQVQERYMSHLFSSSEV
ncbi:MAG: response regulator transcription factor [Clostridia bacterium]|nr:response regulator transcription factor [Clostridia bacterium]